MRPHFSNSIAEGIRTMRTLFALILACVALNLPEASAAVRINPARMKVTASGLRYQDLKVGRGVMPEPGQTVSVIYTGWLWTGKRVGMSFDHSTNRRHPFQFPIDEGYVIPGWDEGISTMRVGGTRLLFIPPDLAYGDTGAGGVIPPGATLIFQVQLLGVK